MCKKCNKTLCYPWQTVCTSCYEVKDRGYLKVIVCWLTKLIKRWGNIK